MATPDRLLEYLVSAAETVPTIESLILFGSRARGDAEARSDYDIAVRCLSDDDYTRWVLKMKEQAPTLCGLDFVRMTESMSPELLRAIKAQGRIIYEKL